METKNQRFKRVASRRTNQVLVQLRLLSNCANKHNYEFSPNDVNKIFSAIEEQLRTTKAAFARGEKKGPFEL